MGGMRLSKGGYFSQRDVWGGYGADRYGNPQTRTKEKAFRMSDGGGLYLWATAAGGKLWRWAYEFVGKEKLMSFGRYPEVSVFQARERHFEARELLATGTDPMAQRTCRINESCAIKRILLLWVERSLVCGCFILPERVIETERSSRRNLLCHHCKPLRMNRRLTHLSH